MANRKRKKKTTFAVIRSFMWNVTQKALNYTAHLYHSNWQIPTHSKQWPGSFLLPPHNAVQKHVALPPLGEACFHWTLCGIPCLLSHLKKENKSWHSCIYPLLLFVLKCSTFIHALVFSMHSESVRMCASRTIETETLNCISTLSFRGQMHWMGRGDSAFLFILSSIFTNTAFLDMLMEIPAFE